MVPSCAGNKITYGFKPVSFFIRNHRLGLAFLACLAGATAAWAQTPHPDATAKVIAAVTGELRGLFNLP